MEKLLLIIIICLLIMSILIVVTGSIFININKHRKEDFIDPTEFYDLSKEYFDKKNNYSFKKFLNTVKSPKIDEKDINPTVYNMSKFKYVKGDYNKNSVENFINKINFV